MTRLAEPREQQLLAVAHLLVDQKQARIVVPPHVAAPGFWFGGGNLVEDPSGNLLLVGRYRDQGDSRLGIAAGTRGCELAIFTSSDRGKSFEKTMSFSKADLSSPGRPVVSIEGSSLYVGPDGVELFVSSEKEGIGYPPGFENYLKSGCGVWTIDHLKSDRCENLKNASINPLFESKDPEYLHVKDPHVATIRDDELLLIFCTHPFSWSSSNSAFATRPLSGTEFSAPNLNWFPRGTTWDVAISRATCCVRVPSVGAFRDLNVTLLFYDGGESLRNLDEHTGAVRRPRGYSCEELGGVAYFLDGDYSKIYRLSKHLPSFISPYGTGCSRYVDVLDTTDSFYVTWQQSQPDGSQPLVMNAVGRGQVEDVLRK